MVGMVEAGGRLGLGAAMLQGYKVASLNPDSMMLPSEFCF